MPSGLRSNAQFEAIEESVFAESWSLPFDTARKMACYGALQEGATYVAYRVQRERARGIGDKVLEAIFHFIGRDEAAHAGFYRAMIEGELAEDRKRTVSDLSDVLMHFKMPGDGIIPNYRERLQATDAGISPRMFIKRVVSPLLATLQIDRDEMKRARHREGLNRLAVAS